MKSLPWSILGLVCLAVAGCRADPNTALLERELRLQEDEIYRLKAKLSDYEDVEVLPGGEGRPDGAGRRQRSRTGAGPVESLLDFATPQGLPDPDAMDRTPPTRAAEADPGVAPRFERSPLPPLPKTPEDLESAPRFPAPNYLDVPESIPSGPETPNGDLPGRQSRVAPSALPTDSSRAARLVLDRSATGGLDADGNPGDEGLQVAVEAVDSQGRSVAAPASMAVVVLDPVLDARVARWDFTAAETASMLRRAGRKTSISLGMLWPEGPPVHRELHLFVRYTTSDGRNLEADGPLRIALPIQATSGWTATEPAEPQNLPTPPTDAQPIAPGLQVRLPDSRLLGPAAPASEATAADARPGLHRPQWSPDRR